MNLVSREKNERKYGTNFMQFIFLSSKLLKSCAFV